MRKASLLAAAGLMLAGALAVYASRTGLAVDPPGIAQFDAAGRLQRPADYRRWVYLSSGFGMSYNPDAGGNGAPAFTNVFVNPASYDYFLANGKWPDKTMFVLEVYGSASHGSINKKGSYQDRFVGLDVEVKDETRFADKWAYFDFAENTKFAAADQPSQNACWKCHDQNAAVEHSFVQFYPELLKIASAKGTLKPTVQRETK